MAFGNVKGITVELGMDASSLESEVKKVESEINGLDKTILALKKSMRFDDGTLVGFESFGTYQELLREKLTQTRLELEKYETSLNNLPAQVDSWNKGIEENQVALDNARQCLELYNQEIVRLESEQEEIKAIQSDLKVKTEELASTIKEQFKVLRTSTTEWKNWTQRLEVCDTKIATLKDNIRNLNYSVDEYSFKMQSHGQAVQQYTTTLDQLKTKQSALKTEQSIYLAQLKTMDAEMAKQPSNVQANIQAMTELGNRYESLIEIQSALSQSEISVAEAREIEAMAINFQARENDAFATSLQEYLNGNITQEQMLQALGTEINVVTSQFRNLDRAVRNQADSTKYNAESYATLMNKITATNDALNGVNTQIKDVSSALKQEKTELKNATDAHKKYSNQLQTAKNDLNDWNKKQQEAVSNQEKSKQKVYEMANAIQRERDEIHNLNQDMEQENQMLEQNRQEIKDVEKAQRGMNNAIKETEGNIKKYEDNLSKVAETELFLKAKIQQLTNEIKKLIPEIKLNEESFQRLQQKAEHLSTSLEKVSKTTKAMSDFFKPFSKIATYALGGAVVEAISFEDAWAGVLKTVDGTESQLKDVNDGLKNLALNTASSYQELAKMAETAGQLGIETDNIVEFTEVSAKLGDTTVLSAENASTALAKMKNIFHGLGSMSNEYYSRFGSAIVDLGNNFATTEDEIVNMSLNMAEAGHQAGMTEADVLALSTALSSMGIKANAGGGSMSKMLQKVTMAVVTGNESLRDFAEMAGMSADQFAKAWKQDAGNAFLKFVEGINGSTDDASVALKNLSDLGLAEEIRLTRSMGALAGATDVYAGALEMAGDAWERNIALDAEAEKRYATLKTALKETWENIKQLGASLGEMLAPALRKGLSHVNDFVDKLRNMSDAEKSTMIKSLAFVASLSPMFKVISKTSDGLKRLAKSFADTDSAEYKLMVNTKKLMTSLSSSGFAPAVVGIIAVASAMTVLAVKTLKARDAIKEKIKEEYYELGVIDDLISKQDEYNNSIEEHSKKANDFVSSAKQTGETASKLLGRMKDLGDITDLNGLQFEMLKGYVNQLNDLYPDLGLSIDTTNGKFIDQQGNVYDSAQALQDYIFKVEGLQDTLTKTAYLSAIQEQTQALVESQIQYEKASGGIEELSNMYKQARKEVSETGDWVHYNNVINELNDRQQELKNTLKEVSLQMEEEQNEINNLAQRASDPSFTTLAESLQQQGQSLIEWANSVGIEVPQTLAQTMKDGSGDVQGAIDWITNMATWKEMVNNAQLDGELIDPAIASALYDGSGSIEDAIEMLNNLIDFQTGVENANGDAKKLTSDVLSIVASGSGDFKQAGRAYAEGGVEAMKEEFDKAPNDAKKTVQDVEKELGDSQGASSAGQSLGQSWYNAFKTWLDTALQSASSTIADLESQLSSLGTSVSNAKSAGKGGKPSSLSSFVSTPYSSIYGGLDARAFSNYYTPSVGASMDVVSSANTLKSVRENKDKNVEGIEKVLNKLDSFIDTFSDIQLRTRTQLITPNGEALTDIVEDTMTIRDMLSNIGKGRG